jgi:hypothetical protein
MTAPSEQVYSTINAWPINMWKHVVCRVDIDATTSQVFMDGMPGPSGTTPAPVNPTTPFGIGAHDDPGLDGYADEVFFVVGLLHEETILRIYACGIDGSQCACDPDTPADYANCGRLQSCDGLPACDADARFIP